MAFPVEQTAANTTQTSNATNWGAQNMPSGVTAGDTLIALMAVDGSNQTITEANWNILLEGATGSDGSVTLIVAWRKATGTDSFSPVISSSQQGSVRILRIDTAEDPDTQAPEVGTATTGASATPNVGAITPVGGTKDYKLYSLCAHDRNRSFTNAPTNYQTNEGSLISGGANGAHLAWGDRDLNGSTDDPDNFTFGASDGFATVVLAIHPVPPPGPIDATPDLTFGVPTADLEGTGKLDATPDPQIVFAGATVDLEAKGKLDATLDLVLAVATADLSSTSAVDASPDLVLGVPTADLKADGKLDATPDPQMVFAGATVDLEALGKLDATPDLVFGVSNADLLDSSIAGAIDASPDLFFTIPTADLNARGKLNAASDLVFSAATALLEATGLLGATAALAFASATADLNATGKLDATPDITFASVSADLTATGLLDATSPMVFAIATADLKAQGAGQIDATPDLIFSSAVADLLAIGKLDAGPTMNLSLQADLLATGKLGASPALVFSQTANLTGRGQLSATPQLAFSLSANLIDGTVLPAKFGRITLSANTRTIAVTAKAGQFN